MPSKALRIPDYLTVARDQIVVYDHFNYFVEADLWTSLQADTTSTVAEVASGGGRSLVNLLSSADNDEAALATSNELFKYVADKSLNCEGLMQFTKPNTDDGSVAFGFADAIGADLITDNGTGIAINDSGAMLYTLKDSTVWRFNTSIGGTAVDSVSTATAGGSAYQTLRIEIIPISSTVFQARPIVDGVHIEDANGHRIQHDITLGTSTDMDFGVYQKDHHADDLSVNVDYLYAAQVI